MRRKPNDVFGESAKKQTTLFDMRLKKLVKSDHDFSIQKDKNETEKQRQPKENENDLDSKSISRLSSQKTEVLEEEKNIEIKIIGSNKLESYIQIPLDYFNVLFYKNKICSVPSGDLIREIHKKWFKDYEKLEVHHGYVQWLFPNYHKSRFNSTSHSLKKEEAEIFKKDFEIIVNLIFSYKLILDFFGIKISDTKKAIFQRTDDYKIRYYETFLTSYHNHLRIERILSHWNVVGFRPYAIEFVKFIEKEIYGINGYRAFLKQMIIVKNKSECLASIKEEDAPLKKLANLDVFPRWRMYGMINESAESNELSKIEEMCQEKYENLKNLSHFFRSNH